MNAFFFAIGRTLYNWREQWFWVLVAFGQFLLLCSASYFIIGHWPQESLDVVVGIGVNYWLVVLGIGAVSIFKESVDRWWSQEKLEQLARDNRPFAIAILWTGTFLKIAALVAILWALKR